MQQAVQERERKNITAQENNSIHAGTEDKLLETVTEEAKEENKREQREASIKKQGVRRKTSLRDKVFRKNSDDDDMFANRKPISEVLHDIYDKNVQ